MRSVVFPDVETMLRARGVPRRPAPSGSFAEDSYDFGVWWRDVRGRPHRLTWIGPRLRDPAAAGELYLVLGGAPSGEVELLCLIPPVPGDRPNENVEGILDGWAEVCGLPRSIDWIRDRAREAHRAGWALDPWKGMRMNGRP